MSDLATIKDVLLTIALVVVFTRWALHWRDKKQTGGGDGRSGDKPASWWELTIGRITREALREHDERVRQPDLLEAAAQRRQLQTKLNQVDLRLEMDRRELERQLAEVVVEIKRQLREGKHDGN